MLKEITAYDSIMRGFIEWNGWGPPTSQFQIQEYCFYEHENECDVDFATDILMMWMNGELDLPDHIQ